MIKFLKKYMAVITFIITFICYLAYKVDFINTDTINNFLKKDDIIIKGFLKSLPTIKEIFLTILLPTFTISSIQLYYFSKKPMKRLADMIHTINSEKLKYSCMQDIEINAEDIANKYASLLSSKNINSILWELESIELSELETKFLSCCCPMNIPIKEKILIQRRNRITSIAKNLIHSKCKYLTTETRKPSEIINTDDQYYKNLRDSYKRKKPIEACRILILKKDVLADELHHKASELEEFINLNKTQYNKPLKSRIKDFISLKNKDNLNDKKLLKSKLKFIVWTNSIDDVFNDYNLNQFYDFAISQRRNKTTVFAQKAYGSNQNCITAFDSDYAANIKTVKKYIDCYENLMNNSSQIDQTTKKYTGNVIYSDFIENIEDAKNFINNL